MGNAIVAVSDNSFDTEVLQSTTPVLVDYWAEWCGPCKMIAPILEGLASEMSGKVKIVKVDIDQHQDLAIRFGVQTIPNLLFFKNGEVVDQVVGFGGRDALTAKVKSLTA